MKRNGSSLVSVCFLVLKVRRRVPKIIQYQTSNGRRDLFSSKIPAPSFFIIYEMVDRQSIYFLEALQLLSAIRFVYSQQNMIRSPVSNENIESVNTAGLDRNVHFLVKDFIVKNYVWQRNPFCKIALWPFLYVFLFQSHI